MTNDQLGVVLIWRDYTIVEGGGKVGGSVIQRRDPHVP